MAKFMNSYSELFCPVCGSKQLQVFFEMTDVPVHCNVLWSTKNSAQNCPKGDIQLTFCPVCSFVFNQKFDSDKIKYAEDYGNPLHFSPLFQVYAQSLAKRLVEQYDLHNKDIIEIGCGDGYFLNLICTLGNNNSVGFDPSYTKEENQDIKKGRIKFVSDLYSERYCNYQSDFIVCRHTFEHIPDPKEFLNELRRTIGKQKNCNIFFEVPNALNIFQNHFVWDIIYEHCSYFSPRSLSLLFSSCGFQVRNVSTEFENQFLCINARPTNQNTFFETNYSKPNHFDQDISSFNSNYCNIITICRNKLERLKTQEKSVILWGAGSKCVTFLNALSDQKIDYAVDINPHKHNKYVPGTGTKIISPDSLSDFNPDFIIVMNSIYEKEIKQQVKKMKLTSDIICL